MNSAAPVPPRLLVEGLHRTFDGRAVVDGVSFAVQAGQVSCLLGPSGCGKSTTLRMVAGVDRPDGGRILGDGRVFWQDGNGLPPEKRGVGLMFQDFALFPHLSVAANIAFGLTGPAAEKRARVASLLTRVGLSRHINAFPHQLSGGEQQRVALARALAPRPGILLMDEPFSGLDARPRDDIRDETLALLKDEGAAVLLVTHEPAEAMRMADEILLMRSGKIVQRGAPWEIYDRPVDRAAAAFFSDLNGIRGIVRRGRVDTPFGAFDADLPEGSAAEIVIRPQHLRIDFGRAGQPPRATEAEGTAQAATVESARFLGIESLVRFRLSDSGAEFRASVPRVFLPPQGTLFWISLPRARCHVFAAG